MPQFRCLNPKCSTDPHGRLIFDFEAADPVCPKCGVDQRVPRYAHLIVKLAVIHFDPPDPVVGGRGQNIPACRPDKTLAGVKATGDPTAVTCKACRETDAFKAADRELKMWDEGDYEIEVNLTKGQGVIVPKG